MSRSNGSVARKLDFGEMTTTAVLPGRMGLRLALPSGVLRGPDMERGREQRL